MKKTLFLLLFIVLCKSSFAQDSVNLDSCCTNNVVPYYYKDSPLQYVDGFYALKSFVIENYTTKKYQEIANNTGIVIIHFNITCNGIVKNITHECFDFDYKIIDMNPTIIEVLQEIVSELKNWKIGVNKDNELFCYHKFLAFKLVNGQIVEVLPN